MPFPPHTARNKNAKKSDENQKKSTIVIRTYNSQRLVSLSFLLLPAWHSSEIHNWFRWMLHSNDALSPPFAVEYQSIKYILYPFFIVLYGRCIRAHEHTKAFLLALSSLTSGEFFLQIPWLFTQKYYIFLTFDTSTFWLALDTSATFTYAHALTVLSKEQRKIVWCRKTNFQF